MIKGLGFVIIMATRATWRLFRCKPRGHGKYRSLTNPKAGASLHIVRKGTGSHPILCIPGALGTGTSDYTPQLTHFGAEGSGFTIVSFDPRGYGESRPPNRIFQTDPVHFLEQDAIDAHGIMSSLGFSKYSVLGWSDGGVAGIQLASKFPGSVMNLAIWGANAYVSKEDIQLFEKTRDIEKWSKRMREPLEAVYGAELGPLWSSWIDSMVKVFERGGDLCISALPLISCPTLVLHGEKDPLVPPFHPKFLFENIQGAVMHTFPNGGHNIHLRFSEEFNRTLEMFLFGGVQ